MSANIVSRWFAIGAAVMALAVALGAFGAHGLKSMVTESRLGTWEVAARYQAYHGLGLLALGLLEGQLGASASDRTRRLLALAGWLMTAGVVVFCGSLYALVLTDIGVLGAITPLGGTAWIAAWTTLAVAVLGHRRRR